MNTVKFTKLASLKLELLLEYLESNWSRRSKDKFLGKLDEKIRTIAVNPEAFPQSEVKPGLRRCIVSKQTSILYSQQQNVIFVVTLYDNRQEQSVIDQEIKRHFG